MAMMGAAVLGSSALQAGTFKVNVPFEVCQCLRIGSLESPKFFFSGFESSMSHEVTSFFDHSWLVRIHRNRPSDYKMLLQR